MKSIKNPFKTGQLVRCISTNFPIWKCTSQEGKAKVGQQAPVHPEYWEVLEVDEILGDFLRFDKYDTKDSNNWWHYNRFRPYLDEGTIRARNIDDKTLASSSVGKEVTGKELEWMLMHWLPDKEG